MTESLMNVYTVHSIPGRREFYPHCHAELEAAYFTSGRGVYSITGREYPIAAGDVFLFSHNEIHKITYVDPAVPMTALNVHFAPRLLLKESESAGLGLTRLFFDRPEGFSNRLNEQVCQPGTQSLCESIRLALSEVGSEAEDGFRKPGSECLARYSLTRALVYMMRAYLPGELLTSDVKLRGERAIPYGGIASALDHIDENFRLDIRLDDLCAISSMSRSNFERLFVDLVGMTPCDYIRRRRIDHALSLLSGTSLSILEIALASGYHNTSNFNRQFRAVVGRTPGEVRRGR